MPVDSCHRATRPQVSAADSKRHWQHGHSNGNFKLNTTNSATQVRTAQSSSSSTLEALTVQAQVGTKLRARDREKQVACSPLLLSCLIVSIALFMIVCFYLLVSTLPKLAAEHTHLQHAMLSQKSIAIQSTTRKIAIPTSKPIRPQVIESIVLALSTPMQCPTLDQQLVDLNYRSYIQHAKSFSARRHYASMPDDIAHDHRYQLASVVDRLRMNRFPFRPVRYVSRAPRQVLSVPDISSDKRAHAFDVLSSAEAIRSNSFSNWFNFQRFSSTHRSTSASAQLEPEMDCSASAIDHDLAQLLQPGAAPGVDVVYTYVDGTDPEWRKLLEVTARLQPDDISLGDFANRYREWGELKYSMRTISRYAPFVRNIYVVVSSPSQVPSWLNHKHNRIRIVFHHELFDDPTSQLPTFNSLAIESVLHRIRGLSRHFLYLNNDVFLNAQLSISDFITQQSYHQFQDWSMLPFVFENEECFKLDFEFEAPPTGGNLNADQYFLRIEKRIDQFIAMAEQNDCFADGKILFYLDRFLMYKLYGVQRRFWAAHVPHLWERCAMYELDRSPLAPFLHRVRRNPFRNPRRDISMHLQYEGLLLSRWDKIRYASRSIEQWRHDVLDADEKEQEGWTLFKFNNRRDIDLANPSIPPVRSVYRLSTKSLNHDVATPFYVYELFDDHNLVKGFGLAWHRNLRLKLATHQTPFVCIDDDLKQLNNPALLVAQRRALLETFQCVWPDPAAWEMN